VSCSDEEHHMQKRAGGGLSRPQAAQTGIPRV
jgi:hypothetical protein